jgi:hypothetical protein
VSYQARTATKPSERDSNPLRTVLLALICAQMLVLAVIPYERELGIAWWRSQTAKVWVWWHTRNDPRPGTKIDWARLGLPDLSVRMAHTPSGLLYVRNCSGCNAASAARLADDLKERHIPLLCLVSSVKPSSEATELIHSECKRRSVAVQFYWDRSGTAQREVNAFFAPRQYLFGKRGILEWIQVIGPDGPSALAPPRDRTPLAG